MPEYESIDMNPSNNIRPPAVAGLFYPADEKRLRAGVTEMLNNVTVEAPAPKALILPHAGYVYSGPVAASGYKQLERLQGQIRKVILLGPSHHVPFNGLATSSCDFFGSPLGQIAVDRANLEKIAVFDYISQIDSAHRQEHSLEVHLPFISQVLGEVLLTPLVVGSASVEEVANVLDAVWGGNETLIIISSDLSHYHDYDQAVMLDNKTSRAILDFRYDEITYDMACGRNAVNGLLKTAHARQLHSLLLDVRNSGDTAGTRDRVVGYGAYEFYAS